MTSLDVPLWRPTAWIQAQSLTLSAQISYYNHSEVDGVWAIYGMYWGSLKDDALSTSGWLQGPKGVNTCTKRGLTGLADVCLCLDSPSGSRAP